jgi:hypothetical protein
MSFVRNLTRKSVPSKIALAISWFRGCVKRPGKGNEKKRCDELAWRGPLQRRVSGGKIKEKEKREK